LRWYDRHRRDLPWRAARGVHPDPYHVLVSEAMLQQTQVATVVPYFHRFVARLPTLAALASADEQEVLRLWQGLGYYRRARNLQATARRVIEQHGGCLPASVEALLALPGVGRYTAGAVASLAFGVRAPILDGNVIRVLCRIDKIESDPRRPDTRELLWRRAEEILPKNRPGDFNSALMELGATVCTPRSPHCLICPVNQHCQAFASGMQDRIPAPRPRRATPLVQRRTFCIQRGDEWLIEQRPLTGRWAGLWQFITIEAPRGESISPVPLPLRATPPTHVGRISHALTHRRYRFDVYRCEATEQYAPIALQQHRWTTLAGMDAYPMSRPHLKIAAMLAESNAAR
jgi:A/G-specific adenine glycosylase